MKKTYKIARKILSAIAKLFEKNKILRAIAKFYPLKRLYHFLTRHLKPAVVEVMEHKMYLDWRDTLELATNGLYEPLVTDFFKREIKQGDVVIDIGAHIGYYSLIFAKLVGENGKVFAFEPEPTNYTILEKNISINGYKNIVLAKKAVSNKSEKIRLYVYKEHPAWHKIYDTHDSSDFIDIDSVRLDDFLKDYNGKINFIKMDIEGAEWLAIKGMLALLEKHQEVKIVTEYGPDKFKAFGIEPELYLKLLIEQGFTLYEFNDELNKIVRTSIDELQIKYTPNKPNSANLLCIR